MVDTLEPNTEPILALVRHLWIAYSFVVLQALVSIDNEPLLDEVYCSGIVVRQRKIDERFPGNNIVFALGRDSREGWSKQRELGIYASALKPLRFPDNCKVFLSQRDMVVCLWPNFDPNSFVTTRLITTVQNMSIEVRPLKSCRCPLTPIQVS